ncbi:MAG TPA: tetratricopeptide repeat protein [Terracidiphilus sp.]|nr:tetratricopeptide repeat protein [Terracidiphilus sp.]
MKNQFPFISGRKRASEFDGNPKQLRSVAHALIPRPLGSLILALFLLFSSSVARATSPQTSYQEPNSVTITGRTESSSGSVVSGADVRLEVKDTSTILDAKSDETGRFTFSGLKPGTYKLSAVKQGSSSRTVELSASAGGESLHPELIFDETKISSNNQNPSPPGAQMEFSDRPSFTIAGVTDWTAAGGHGSDSILRTSEALTRETVALKTAETGKPQPDSALTSPGALQTENDLRAALNRAPDSFETNHRLGAYYLLNGRYQDSIPFLEKANKLARDNYDNSFQLAVAYEGAGDYSKAKTLVEALKAKRDSGDLHRIAAEIDEKTGQPMAAANEYEQAVRMDPSEKNYFAWGSELLVHRAIWQAREVFNAGIKAFPNSARMQTALGTALFAGALYDEAALRFCKASDLEPESDEPYVLMGKIEIASPSPLVCVAQKLKQFASREPGNALANYFYAMAIWKQHTQGLDAPSFEQVKSLLARAVTLDPTCSDALLQLGNLASLRGDYKTAIGLYTQAIQANPQLNEAHYRLGVAYDRVGDRARAKQEFQLHETLQREQAADVQRQRLEVKQFVVKDPLNDSSPNNH